MYRHTDIYQHNSWYTCACTCSLTLAYIHGYDSYYTYAHQLNLCLVHLHYVCGIKLNVKCITIDAAASTGLR